MGQCEAGAASAGLLRPQRRVRCGANRDMSAAMKVAGKHTRSIWVEADGKAVGVIDQTLLPHRFATIRLETLDDAARAIVTMQVRGAPLIGPMAFASRCGPTPPTNRWSALARRCLRRGRPRSI
jgi:methylthioribose-1-phosphate isomerase